MSADSGVYILETRKKHFEEYRVAFLQNADEIDFVYDPIKVGNCEYLDRYKAEDQRIKTAREFFKDAKVFDNLTEAREYAFKLHEDLGWTEYGVCSIRINMEF